jgi:hypothetical protein
MRLDVSGEFLFYPVRMGLRAFRRGIMGQYGSIGSINTRFLRFRSFPAIFSLAAFSGTTSGAALFIGSIRFFHHVLRKPPRKAQRKLSGAKYIFLYSKESGKNKSTVPISIEKQALNTIRILSIDRSPCIRLASLASVLKPPGQRDFSSANGKANARKFTFYFILVPCIYTLATY